MNLGIIEQKNTRVQAYSAKLVSAVGATGAELCCRMMVGDDPARLMSAAAYLTREVNCIVFIGDNSLIKGALSKLTGWSESSIAGMTVVNGCDVIIAPDNLDEAYIEAAIIPAIAAKFKVAFSKESFRVFGLTEAQLNVLLKDQLKQRNKMPITFEGELLDYEVSIKYSNKMGKMTVDEFVSTVRSRLAPYTYSTDNRTIYQTVTDLLRVRGKQLAIAESFTGGAVCSKIVQISGASRYLYEGVVPYCDAAKAARLGVPPDVLETDGAVSGHCAYEMIAGLLASGNCDIALATTGYAEPSQANGLCYIAVGDKDGVHVFEHYFSGSREENIELGCLYSFYYLYKLLSDGAFEE